MRILPDKETLTTEFKSDLKKYSDNDIFDAVVAFANTEGGDLYLGIEDDGKITGAHGSHQDPTTVSAFIANNTIPPVPVRAEVIVDNNLPVLKISVPKSYSGIVATRSGKVLRRRMKADNTPENIPMYPNEYQTRLSDLRLLDYSAMPIYEANTDDFDMLEVEHLKKIIMAYNGDRTLLELDNDSLFKALGFVRDQNGVLYPTIAGLLLVGKVEAIKRYIPTASSVFQVLEGSEVRMNEDIDLPVLASIEKINTYINAWNPEQEIEMGLFRISVPDFDKRAVREAIVNAYSHRDYTKMGRVRVAITDEGLTIANPGGFIEGVTIKNLLTAEPHGRNPLLADALKRIGLAERTGRGIDRIYEGSLLYGKPLPDYSKSTTVTVSVFLTRGGVDVQIAQLVSNEQSRLGRPLSVNTLLVLNALKDFPKSNTQQVAEAINLSEPIVHEILERGIESGIVEAFGKGKNRSYMLSAYVYKTTKNKIGYVRQADIEESRYKELVLNLAKHNEFVSRADVVELLRVNGDKAYHILRSLTKDGYLKMVNKGRHARYQYIR